MVESSIRYNGSSQLFLGSLGAHHFQAGSKTPDLQLIYSLDGKNRARLSPVNASRESLDATVVFLVPALLICCSSYGAIQSRCVVHNDKHCTLVSVTAFR